MNKQILQNLHEQPEFRMLLDALEKSRPIVPQYDPAVDNYRLVCSNMLIQQGFDRALQIINPFKERK